MMLPTKFQVNWPFGSGEEAKNRFSRWPPSSISDGNDFNYFWSTSHPDASYQLSSQLAFGFMGFPGEKRKIDFQDGHHDGNSGFPIGMVLTTFDLQVTPMLPTKFQVNWPLGSEGEAKNRFSRWPPWRQSWIFDWTDFSYFWSTSHPNASYQVSSQLAFWFRRRSEK